MYSCQWVLDIQYGKQSQALSIMKQWGAEKMRSSHFRVSTCRMMTGFAGESASHIVDEYLFESLNDFELALKDMGQPQFKIYSDQLAPLVVAGSQRWLIYKLVE